MRGADEEDLLAALGVAQVADGIIAQGLADCTLDSPGRLALLRPQAAAQNPGGRPGKRGADGHLFSAGSIIARGTFVSQSGSISPGVRKEGGDLWVSYRGGYVGACYTYLLPMPLPSALISTRRLEASEARTMDSSIWSEPELQTVVLSGAQHVLRPLYPVGTKAVVALHRNRLTSST